MTIINGVRANRRRSLKINWTLVALLLALTNVLAVASLPQGVKDKDAITGDTIIVMVTSQGKPLEGATVYAESLEKLIVLNKKKNTDASGEARITVDGNLLYTVSVIKDGYTFGQEKVFKPGSACKISVKPLPPGAKIYTTAHNHMGPPFLVPYVGVSIWNMEVARDRKSGLPMGGARFYARNNTVKIDGKSNKASANMFYVEVPFGKTFKIEQDGKSASVKIVGWRKQHIVAEWENNGLVDETNIEVQENTAWYKVEQE